MSDPTGGTEPLPNAAVAFIAAAVTLILVVIFMILIVILVRQCLALRAKRRALRERQQQEATRVQAAQRRRGSVTEAVPATFDWHHSIRVEGTPPPTYNEAEKLPPIENGSHNRKDRDMEPVSKKASRTNSTAPLISDSIDAGDHERELDSALRSTDQQNVELNSMSSDNTGFSSQYIEYEITN